MATAVEVGTLDSPVCWPPSPGQRPAVESASDARYNLISHGASSHFVCRFQRVFSWSFFAIPENVRRLVSSVVDRAVTVVTLAPFAGRWFNDED